MMIRAQGNGISISLKRVLCSRFYIQCRDDRFYYTRYSAMISIDIVSSIELLIKIHYIYHIERRQKMTIILYQSQYAVSKTQYEEIRNGSMSTNDLKMTALAAILKKEINSETAIIPHIGETVSDSYWPRDFCEQKVIGVCYSYADNTCTITLEPFVIIANSILHTNIENISASHGWKCQKV